MDDVGFGWVWASLERTDERTDESDERLGQCCESAQKVRFGAASAELPRLLPGKPSTPTTSDNMYSVKWDLLLTTGGRCIPLCPRSGETSHRVLSVLQPRTQPAHGHSIDASTLRAPFVRALFEALSDSECLLWRA